jgi:AIG2-like family
MDRAAMAARCPASKPLGSARLARHRFIVTSDGYASVVRDPRRTVWGLLWDIAFADMPALDRYESVASGLYVKLTQSVITERGARRALIYVGRSAGTGQPRPGYLKGVVAAAREAGLPADYIAEVEAWSPQSGTRHTSAPARRPVPALWSSPLAKES